MASGRLGAAVVGASRTLTVYDNTSGFSAAISLLAKMRSSTSNGTISVILDSSSTAPETATQISTTSFTKEVFKLFYNSTIPASISSVTGKFEFSTYGNAEPDPKITELPSGTVTQGSTAFKFNPLWMTDTWFDWGIPGDKIPIVDGNSSASYYLFTQNQYDSAGIEFKKRQISTSVSMPTSTYNTATSSTYGNNYGDLDPYCNMLPYFHCATNAYMGVCYLRSDGTNANQHTRSTSSFFYQRISNNNPGSNTTTNKRSIHASGGIVLFTHQNTGTAWIVCYGRNVTQDNRLYHCIEDTVTVGGANYPYFYRIGMGSSYNSNSRFPVTFFEYNPNTQKSYGILYWNGKRRLLEFNVDAWETALAGTAVPGNTEQSFDATVTAGLITDISDGAGVPAVFKEDQLVLSGPVLRTAKSTWVIPVRVGSTYYRYETNDFKSYTLHDQTQNYSETLDSDTVVLSDGTDTDKIASNFDGLNQAGLIEYQTSFNDYERTGLVISNNDRVIVRNNGTENIAVNVMGYEETA